jgi:hypothetical protein
MPGHVDQQTFMPLTGHLIFDLAADEVALVVTGLVPGSC